MDKLNKKKDALDYHSKGRPGKIQVLPTKPTNTQRDLTLAYSPGVAEPCLKIAENKEDVYKYTAKGNLVAVISNGSAVLGLGNIGPEAGKPVMEGKGLLFKIFADIDVFDLELDVTDVDEFVKVVKSLEPTFGGINLEDIKAPECFEIERRLKEEMSIPVMHDDQHGTAIISSAALLNACELQGKKLDEIKIVVNGAGAAAISCSRLYVSLGVPLENIVMLDRSGVIRKDRERLDSLKAEFATGRDLRTLEDAMVDADVFIGLSAADTLSPEALLTMAARPIVFAMANPNPEIAYDLAVATRDDIIMATGRSDYPNQVNNVLGFPYIFRGAMDVRARTINEEMKIAAVKAIAELAKKTVPEAVVQAYSLDTLKFGKDYIIPKPMDPRLIATVSSAVAKAAMDSGVAREAITDWDAYSNQLSQRLGGEDPLLRNMTFKAKANPQKVVFAEADQYKVLKAAQIIKDENIAVPVLLGSRKRINHIINEYALDLQDVTIVDPEEEHEKMEEYAQFLYNKRQRKGVTLTTARGLMRSRNYFGACMLEFGEVDAMVSGLTHDYGSTLRAGLHVIGTQPGVNRVAGMYAMLTKKGPVFFADTTVNINPDVQEIVDITVLVDSVVRKLNIRPRIALLSYSNFGSAEGKTPGKMAEATRILHEQYPHITVDGDLQANFATNPRMMKESFGFSMLNGAAANTLIFPNLESGNISYKLLQELGNTEALGPMLLGLNKPFHILQMASTVREIVNMATIAAVDAQSKAVSVHEPML